MAALKRKGSSAKEKCNMEKASKMKINLQNEKIKKIKFHHFSPWIRSRPLRSVATWRWVDEFHIAINAPDFKVVK